MQGPLRILLGWPAPEMSVWDVAAGYARALRDAGHNVRDFAFNKRLQYHGKAIGQMPDAKSDPDGWLRYKRNVMKQASETIVIEALYHQADLVLLICGLNFHPVGGWLLRQVDIPVAVLLTESPYEDDAQQTFVREMQARHVFTNERRSAERYGWTYVRHAYEPRIHRPRPPIASEACDVLFVGTGWTERQKLLEAVDWTGINLRLIGMFPDLDESSPLRPFYKESIVDNDDIAKLYSSAKICLNFHRKHHAAESVNPRIIEAAAIGTFQVSDSRAEMVELFGSDIPTFETPAQLETLLRSYLQNSEARRLLALSAREKVLGETFSARVQQINPILQAIAERRQPVGAVLT